MQTKLKGGESLAWGQGWLISLLFSLQLFVQQGKRWKARMLPMDIATTFISQFHSWKSENDFIISLLTEGNEDEVFWKWFDMQV